MKTTTTSLGFIPLCTEPDLSNIIRNLGSSYSGPLQAINELVDNSVSDLRGSKDTDGKNPHFIRITLEELGEMVGLTVEDSGSGIADLENALRVAGRDAPQTPLNEHGQGLKQSLLYLTRNGGDWSIDTRSEVDRDCNNYIHVAAPYNKFAGEMQAEVKSGWCGELSSTGTVVHIDILRETLAAMVPGEHGGKVLFARMVKALVESLRYTYADLLERGGVAMELVAIPVSGKAKRETLKPLLPNWRETLKDIKPTPVDLGGGNVTISGRLGFIAPSEDAESHYQANLATSGAVISINGRIILRAPLGAIYNRANHPSGNTLLLRLDIQSDELAALPETTVEKNGFRAGDPRLDALFRWIRTNVALPPAKEKLELRLFKLLEARLRMDSAYTRITREMFVFATLGVRDRLDLFTSAVDGTVTAYEGKAKTTKTADVYQLRRYWDGCVRDGIAVTDGVLVGSKHNDDVRALVAYLNTQIGEDGRPYRFRLATWAELGIDVSAA